MVTTSATAPDTIVLIHGLWMTPRSWEHWIDRYRRRGYNVLAPAYPGMEVEVEALRLDPAPIEHLSIEQVADHYAQLLAELPRQPILVGHSFGGALVQILLDRGFGHAGVAIDSVPVKGVLVPFTTLRATWPFLRRPSNRRRAVGFTPEQFHHTFANTLSDGAAREAYERYHVPAPGRMVFEGALANFQRNPATKVDFDKQDRAPLLFVAGGEDHLMPAKLNRRNARHYHSGVVAYHEFPSRSHYTVGEPGWEEVADFALEWALKPTIAA